MAAEASGPIHAAIPVPEQDIASLHRTCVALKQSLEMLLGADATTRTGFTKAHHAAHVFIQPTTPKPLHEGDMWLCTGLNYTFNIWTKGKWLVLCTLPAVP